MSKITTIFTKFFNANRVVESISDYIEYRTDLLKIEIKENVSRFLAQALLHLIVFTVGIFFVFFVSMGLAMYWGYLFVAGLHVFLLFCVWLMRKFIGRKLKKYFMKMMKKK